MRLLKIGSVGVVVSFEKIVVKGQLCDACWCCDVDWGLVYSFGGDFPSVAKGLEPLPSWSPVFRG